MSDERISVAVSGGGHRATSWALGALLYLADTGRNGAVDSVASVSGGSIANGVVAHEMDYRSVTGADMRAKLRPLVKVMATTGLMLWGKPTNRYVRTVLYGGFALGLGWLAYMLMLAFFHADVAARMTWFGLLLFTTILWLWLFGRRSEVVDRAMRKRFFSRTGNATRLADIDSSVLHVFCATEMQAGNHFYMAPGFVATYRFGVGKPGDLPLSTAVQASACFPLGFRARRLPAAPFGFEPFVGAEGVVPKWVVLEDGGVYDNMAEQWTGGYAARLRRWPGNQALPPEPSTLFVVNASGGWTWNPIRSVGWPRGEISMANRVQAVLYDGTTAQRRANLINVFDRAAKEGKGMRGVLVHIATSPALMATKVRANLQADSGRRERAQAVLDWMGVHSDEEMGYWDRVAAENAGTATTLGALGVARVAQLLWHSYVLSASLAHIMLDYPLPAFPTLQSFVDYVQTA